MFITLHRVVAIVVHNIRDYHLQSQLTSSISIPEDGFPVCDILGMFHSVWEAVGEVHGLYNYLFTHLILQCIYLP